MSIRTVLAILLSSILWWSCRDSGSSPMPSPLAPNGAFSFTSYNEGGSIDETGWLLLDVTDPGHVMGTWQLSKRGSGELRGSVENGRVVVDLHPGYADNNYILDGVIQRGDYSGSWTQIGFVGIIESGRFEAHAR